jgi:hypothetical protein
MVALRLGWPVFAFFFMASDSLSVRQSASDRQSLWFTLIERAFQIPMWDFLGAGGYSTTIIRSGADPSGGFVALWMLNYVTLIAAGFAMETVLAVVGIPFLPFFLILWIIRERPLV